MSKYHTANLDQDVYELVIKHGKWGESVSNIIKRIIEDYDIRTAKDNKGRFIGKGGNK